MPPIPWGSLEAPPTQLIRYFPLHISTKRAGVRTSSDREAIVCEFTGIACGAADPAASRLSFTY